MKVILAASCYLLVMSATCAQDSADCPSDGEAWAGREIPDVIQYQPGNAAQALSALMNCTLGDGIAEFKWAAAVVGSSQSISIKAQVQVANPSTPFTGKTVSYYLLEGNEAWAIRADATMAVASHTGWDVSIGEKGPPIASIDDATKFSAYATSTYNEISQGQIIFRRPASGISDVLSFSVAAVGTDIKNVTFITEPQGAEVWINAKLYGSTTRSLGVRESVLKSVVFRMAGYGDCASDAHRLLGSSDNVSQTVFCKLVPSGIPAP